MVIKMNQWLRNALVILSVLCLLIYGTYCGNNQKDSSEIGFDNAKMILDSTLTEKLFDILSNKFIEQYDTVEAKVFKSDLFQCKKIRVRMSLKNVTVSNDSVFYNQFMYPVFENCTNLVGGDSIYLDVKISYRVNNKYITQEYKNIVTKAPS